MAERIEGRDDEAALRALAAVVDKQDGMPGTQAAAVAESRVSEALAQPEMAELAPDSTAGASDGDVARATLVYRVDEVGLHRRWRGRPVHGPSRRRATRAAEHGRGRPGAVRRS